MIGSSKTSGDRENIPCIPCSGPLKGPAQALDNRQTRGKTVLQAQDIITVRFSQVLVCLSGFQLLLVSALASTLAAAGKTGDQLAVLVAPDWRRRCLQRWLQGHRLSLFSWVLMLCNRTLPPLQYGLRWAKSSSQILASSQLAIFNQPGPCRVG